MTNLKSQISNLKNHFDVKGVASLGITLILGSIIVEIGLAVAFLGYLLNFTNFGIRLSAEALAAAKSGINDGLLRVVKGDTSASYSLPVGDANVDITINKGGCVTDPQKIQITAIGSVLGKKHKLESCVEIDSVSKGTKIEFIREISI